MSLQVKQDTQYQGNNLWKWSVWIEGPSKELGQIDSVTYTLDPSFPNSVQVVKNRTRKFRLDAAGFSKFRIDIAIKRKNGRVLRKMHWLELENPSDVAKRRVGHKQPVVYLTSAAVDADITASLRQALESRDIKVLTSVDAPADVPLQESISSLVDEVNIAVAVVSDWTSPWVVREATFLRKHALPVIPVVVGERARIPEALRGIASIPMTDASEAQSVAGKIAEQIGRPEMWKAVVHAPVRRIKATSGDEKEGRLPHSL